MLISLALPVDAHTVPLARHLVAVLLQDLNVTEHTRHEVELALSEACANVVRHAETQADYELQVRVGDNACDIVVSDKGKGFDAGTGRAPSTRGSSSGRGLELMRSLMDDASFRSGSDEGTAVHLHKKLSFDDAPLNREAEHGTALP